MVLSATPFFYHGFCTTYFLGVFFTISIPNILRLYSVTLCSNNFSYFSRGNGLFLFVEFDGWPGKSIVRNSFGFNSSFVSAISFIWDYSFESSLCKIERREVDLILTMLLVEHIEDFLTNPYFFVDFCYRFFYLCFLCEFFILFSSSS